MATVKPFKGIRPVKELASKIAALPYDVMNSEEAREMVKGNPYSFLHVDRAEIDLDPSIDVHDKKVYEKARENLIIGGHGIMLSAIASRGKRRRNPKFLLSILQ